MKKKREMYSYGGKRMGYANGGNVTNYSSIQEKERKCSVRAGMNTMKIKGEK